MTRLTAIVPALNEADGIVPTLDALRGVLDSGDELLVVDGGSDDETVSLARPRVDQLLSRVRGRARQMNAGAEAARGDVLWFVHADTLVSEGAGAALRLALAHGASWGRFDVRISGRSGLLRAVAAAMNVRSRVTGIATGDQGIFVTRALFESVGGYEEIPLMEDVRLSAALRRSVRPACIRAPRLVTSGRRWETRGVLRTIALMARLRALHACGASPAWLAAQYRG